MTGLRVAIYARFSSDKQSDASIEDQVHRARSFLAQHGHEPDAAVVLSDFAVSGASMDRPGMRALLNAINARELDLIVTESVDRISRDVGDADRFRKLLMHRGVALECLDGTRVNNAKSDALMFGVRALFAEQYRLDLADKTRRGLEGRARAGAPTGVVPYGFSIIAEPNAPKTIRVDDEHAAVVRRIFALYATGRSFAAIAAELNAGGVVPPRAHSRRSGEGWMHSAIRAILLNERYLGRWIYGAREWIKTPGSNVRRPQVRRGGPLVIQERPELAIIDAPTWEAVQARFARNPEMPGKKRSFLLSGILHCGVCNGRMHFSGGSSRFYFGCAAAHKRHTCENRRNVPIAEAEARVLEAIRVELRKRIKPIRQRITARVKEWSAARPSRRLQLGRELAEVSKKLSNLIDLAAATGGSAAVAAKVRELEGRRSKLQAELVAAEAPAVTLPLLGDEEILSLQHLTSAPVDEARERLRSILVDGRIYCRPSDQAFKLEGGLLPLKLFIAFESRRPPSGETQGRPLDNDGCGGRI